MVERFLLSKNRIKINGKYFWQLVYHNLDMGILEFVDLEEKEPNYEPVDRVKEQVEKIAEGGADLNDI